MKNILVVDDNNTIQLLLTRQLEALGWRPHVVANGEEALKTFQKTPVDLVIMDIHMPSMDGLEVVRRIRALENERGLDRVPIIGLSSGITYDLRACLAAGLDDLMQKPALLDDLSKTLRPWLSCDD